MKYLSMVSVWLIALTTAAQQDVSFIVTFDESVQSTPATGRLTVYLMRTDSGIRFNDPADAPFYENPQPMFSIEVNGMRPGELAVINDDNCEFFPVLPSELEPGTYRVQAVLDQSRTASNWRYEEGNLHSPGHGGSLNVTKRGVAAPVHVMLRMSTRKFDARGRDGLTYISVKSELLSEFHGREVHLRAGVVSPISMKPDRRYPAVYQVPRFESHITSAVGQYERLRAASADSDLGIIARNAYWITLDVQGPNGHLMFADSANNGPVGEALIRELIPKIDASFNTIPKSSARLLRGHFSGGWSAIWLGITYPDTFGGMWSVTPDPVDFSAFKAIDIYHEPNMYRHEELGQVVWNTSYTDVYGAKGMTIRDENRMEEVIGPGNTSGKRWDSWLAAFGPVDDDGNPANLYHPQTGEIDSRIVKHFAKYDIAKKLAADRATLGPLMKERLRLVVGDRDNHDLDEAVLRLKTQLDALTFAEPTGGFAGYIEILPGLDQAGTYRSSVVQDFPRQMLEELIHQGHIDAQETE